MVVIAKEAITITLIDDPNDFNQFIDIENVKPTIMQLGGSPLIKEDVNPARKPLNYVFKRFQDSATPQRPVTSEG